MAGEVANITDVAVKVTKDIFKWFKWEAIPTMDEILHAIRSISINPSLKRQLKFLLLIENIHIR